MQDKKDLIFVLIFIISLLAIFFMVQWASDVGFIFINPDQTVGGVISNIFAKISPSIIPLRVAFLGMVVVLSWFRPMTNIKNPESKAPYAYLVLAIVFGLLFIPGLLYQSIFYPIIMGLAAFFIIKSSQLIQNQEDQGSILKKVSSSKASSKTFEFKTDKGKLVISSPTKGFYIEGAAGSGKSVLIEDILHQACLKGYAGFLYDFEGDPNEGGALLSKTVYASLLEKKQHHSPTGQEVRFAFLNFTDPLRTVRCNPLALEYIKSNLEVMEVANIIMKNLEKEWVEKTDFWANNAINYLVGCIMMLKKYKPEYCTLPHVISMVLSNYEAVLSYLSTDEEIERIMLPMITAHKEQAKSQTAGVISSSQLPITKLFTPEIYWVLSPPAQEAFGLDITSPQHPVFFCVGNAPNLKTALSPVLALIASVCMRQMNQLGKHKSVFVIDELPTIYIPNLDNLPATARKKGVCSVLAVQSYNQLVRDYGKSNAEITRDNLSNQFIGKTNSFETADRISKMLGEYQKRERSHTIGEGGESTTESLRYDKYIKPNEVMQQKAGQFTGLVADGDPAFFSCQMPFFQMKKKELPYFSNPFASGDISKDKQLMQKHIGQNFHKINHEIKELIQPFMPNYNQS